MVNRYYLTGAQLGMLMSDTDETRRMILLNEIMNYQQIDNYHLTNPSLDEVIRIDGGNNPRDDSGACTSLAKEGNGHRTFPAGSKYNEQWDSYYDEKKDIWLEPQCNYEDCQVCNDRPSKPSSCKDSENKNG